MCNFKPSSTRDFLESVSGESEILLRSDNGKLFSYDVNGHLQKENKSTDSSLSCACVLLRSSEFKRSSKSWPSG